MSMPNSARGFTLLEVMVALAIFAVASVSLLSAQEAQIRTDSKLADKTLAHWAALNRLAELQLQGNFPDIGQGESPARMGDRDWVVTTKIEGLQARMCVASSFLLHSRARALGMSRPL